MSGSLVLVVEDEADIRELVEYSLTKAGFQVTGVVTGEEALAAVEAQSPDVVVLDLMLPGIDGLNVCRRLKKDLRTNSIPIVMLTAKGEESDVVRGLEMGADDYITKPFSPRVLIARLQAVLRRAASEEEHDAKEHRDIIIRNLEIRPRRHEVLVDGNAVDLTATEYRVLVFLAKNPGWVSTRNQILDGVHGGNYAITERAVDVQIVGLRRKLGSAGEFIETVRGVGYRFKE
ncbi:MAG: response regulator transcription factor [Pirellulales bacterium]|nr:response regulator transcription factor [Pirellulales bacterium]